MVGPMASRTGSHVGAPWPLMPIHLLECTRQELLEVRHTHIIRGCAHCRSTLRRRPTQEDETNWREREGNWRERGLNPKREQEVPPTPPAWTPREDYGEDSRKFFQANEVPSISLVVCNIT